ncbi:MAG: 5-methyltetrahydropteroyltriglutamate--homocysteine S-methyltransferase [Betaproteobacteria bacterium]|nr:5-methyltetrahydropteroyltriglutamate--homocysteine S-methyltransferase [Betaproteobacteria bacterium]
MSIATSVKPPFRADHVGSLLRPPELHEARARAGRGEIDLAALRAVEDKCIKEAVALQESVGMPVITDGEFRRAFWHVDFLLGFGGVETSKESFAVKFLGTEEQPPLMKVLKKIRRTKPNMLDHFTFVKPLTQRTVKFCIPSPAMLHLRSDRAALKTTYPDIGEFWEDLAAAYRAEIKALADAGCTYLQIDDTSISNLCDPKVRAETRVLGDDPDKLPAIYAEAVNMCLRDLPKGMTVATHTCRGNFKSTWMASGGYDPVAEVVFGQMNVGAFFLEYDSDRAGGFEPLRFMPKGKKVVLGLISSKFPDLENKDELKRRIEAASKFVPLDDLCLSPQCGFSSTHHGNNLSMDDQKRKLALTLEVAREVWGSVE